MSSSKSPNKTVLPRTRPAGMLNLNKLSPIEVAAVWESLSQAIDTIMQLKNASSLSFEEVYRYAYKLVLAKQADFLYDNIAEKIRQFDEAIANKLINIPNDRLLSELSSNWEYHKTVMSMVKDILMYMDRHFQQHQSRLPVFPLSLKIFRETVILHNDIRERIRVILLENILKERNGNIIDKHIMKTILEMLQDVSVDSTTNNKFIYEEEFEPFFLNETREYYRTESQIFLTDHTIPDYLIHAELRLQQESQRVAEYLPVSTSLKLNAVLDEELISNQLSIILDVEDMEESINSTNGSYITLIKENRLDDLRRLYSLLSRVPMSLDILRIRIGEYTKLCGLNVILSSQKVKEVSESAASTTSNSNSVALQFINELLHLQSRLQIIINEAFQSDKKAQKKLQDAFDFVVNFKGASKLPSSTQSSTSASIEASQKLLMDSIDGEKYCASSYLASFYDELLRNGIKNIPFATDVESIIDKSIFIFRYIANKDLFESHYKQYLSKRLLQSKSNSDDIEKLLLVKLKAECGYQFTSKLEGMVKDIQMSKVLMSQYKTNLSSIDEIAIECQVLTAGYWPLQASPSCNLPLSLTKLKESFNTFYQNTNSGTKLTWILSLGTVDIKANFPSGRKDLNVSVYQACILNSFNESPSFSLQQLRDACGIPEIELKRHLLSLCTPKLRLLKKSTSAKGILEDEVFTINEEFSSRYSRIKVPLVSLKEVSTEVLDNTVDVNGIPLSVIEDRKNSIDASIVRLMKTRKFMTHNDLVAEVTRHLSGRFLPAPSMIKSRVESLIEREYITRDDENIGRYQYLA